MGWVHATPRTVAAGVAVLAVIAFAFVPSTARAAMDRPTWSAGDFWVYAFSAGTSGNQTNGTLRFDVTGSESITVNGTSYSAYHIEATLTIPFGSLSFTVPAKVWFSTDTLAIVKITATITLSFGNFSADSTISVAGNPPQTIHWPLTAGDTWTSSTTVWTAATNSTGATTYSSSALTTVFFVQSDTSITVPAGTFAATPLKETNQLDGSYSINYWSAPVGNWGRVEEYNSSGGDQGGFNLTAYHYSGGSFFTSVVLGLPIWIWLVLLVLILVAIVGFFAIRRRQPPMMPQPIPPTMPPQEPPMGPEGPPPGSPP